MCHMPRYTPFKAGSWAIADRGVLLPGFYLETYEEAVRQCEKLEKEAKVPHAA